MKVGIVGSGVIGSATGIGLSKLGHSVVFNDISSRALQRLALEGYNVTDNYEQLVESSQVIVVCVPTPTVDGRQDLSYINDALGKIGYCLRSAEDYKVIVIRSTVLPTYTRTKFLPLLEDFSGLNPNGDFGLCANPEFLREASPLEDFMHPWRIIIGEYDRKAGAILEKMYAPLKTKIIRTSLEMAEMAKYASNTFLATKISFFNEMFFVAKRLNVDPKLLAKIVGLDPRIGDYGTVGGKPFDGKCLPKDSKSFREFISSLGLDPLMLSATLEVNNTIANLKNYDKSKLLEYNFELTCFSERSNRENIEQKLESK